MSTLKIRLVGADSYSFRKKKYLRGKLYELPEQEANELMDKADDNGYAYFELPHERTVEDEEVHAPEATSASERKPAKAPARRKAAKPAKKTIRVSGGNVTEDGGEGDGSDDKGEDEGVEV